MAIPVTGSIPTLVALVLLVLVVIKTSRKRSAYPLPPGPPKRPIIGNLLDLPTRYEWLTYTKWAKQYDSDVLHVSGAGKDLVILNTVEAARDLLEKRSATYSGRPAFLMGKLMGWDYLFSSMPYGDAWRERRKLFQKYFHPTKPETHRPIETEYVRKLLPELLEHPQDFMTLFRHLIGATTLVLAYGLDIKLDNDPFVHLADDSMRPLIEAIVPGAFLVDLIPALQYVPAWFPGAGFQRKAKEWKKMTTRFRDAPYDAAKRAVAEGKAKSSFTSMCLEQFTESNKPEFDEDLVRDTASMFFAGGSDTVLAAVYTFILAMLCHPDKQAKAQEELDRVVGHGRLPDYNDEPNLPYLSAVIKETFRWRPVTPMGVPHCSEGDDVYNGYLIPSGSIMIVNLWNIMHNEEDYPDPDTFLPERFLDPNGNIDKTVRDPMSVAFGFGRRICPGEHMARSTLWLTAASILALFKLAKPVKDGAVVEPTKEYLSALVCHTAPFECDFKPRSRATEQLVKSLVE
ncbi:cytochrome P450 [Macrolepiota fuliginosa MF-IS2]|uniref:Cytochrome P450 n=1 Tax=Macrolepiota fuliginosa MF-IS2 TaxID=1400762 RepID=A0A9P5XA79_9AGAR|nr:cytochrome P450 [Macrolepiota fuliginosa MF-IS2]